MGACLIPLACLRVSPPIHHLRDFRRLLISYSNNTRYFGPFNFRVMATVARYIYSHYDPETEREDLLLETGQTRASMSSGYGRARGGIGFSSGGEGGQNVDDGDQEEEIDPWLVELPYAPAKFNPPLKFVKSVLSYEDVNDYIERGYEFGLPERAEENDKDVEEERKGISSWYRNLSRTNVNTPAPTPVPGTSTMEERTARAGTLDHPLSSSGATYGSVVAITQRASEQTSTSDPPSQPREPPQHQLRSSTTSRRRSDWFATNALSHSPASGYGSPAPGPRPTPTLADMLARDPPPNKSQEAYTPPTWIMLPPSNRGFQMLQKNGWSEGEPLGPYFTRRQDAIQTEQQPVAGPSDLGRKKAAQETRITEVAVEGYDDIVEIKKGQVIDLTVSDDGEYVSSGDEEISDEDVMELDDEIPESFSLLSENSNPASARPSPPQGEGHGGKALLTPLSTVLKSDRLGIGLKAKTVGPYKASQKRVTHNAAALAAHAKASEERRLFKQKIGRGSRGFARAEKSESEKRRSLLAYLNQ